jgi:hypothetical protein
MAQLIDECLQCRRAALVRDEAADDIPKLQAFFDDCKRNNPQFYYKFQLDDKNVVKNVFWCHASQQGDYKGTYQSALSKYWKWLTHGICKNAEHSSDLDM